MPIRHKPTSKYRIGPINSLGPSCNSIDGRESVQRPQTINNDASSLQMSSKHEIRRKTRRIGEIDNDSEEFIDAKEDSKQDDNKIIPELSQDTPFDRIMKKAKLVSSDDTTMFWKVSPRQKKVKSAVCSSPLKADDDSLVLLEELSSEQLGVELSPERFSKIALKNNRNHNVLGRSVSDSQAHQNDNKEPNNLNESIIQSLKSLKGSRPSKSQENDRNTAFGRTSVDKNMASVLQQIGSSMLNSSANILGDTLEPAIIPFLPFTTPGENAVVDAPASTEYGVINHSDEFSDDEDNNDLLLQITDTAQERPAVRGSTTVTTIDDDIFSDDSSDNGTMKRITESAETIFIETMENDSFSDDDSVSHDAKPTASWLFNENENGAKSAIRSPNLHRFQIKEVREAIYKSSSYEKKQKILKCLDRNDKISTILVRDSWSELDFQPLDIIHIITSNETDRYQLVDNDHNILVWNPDELVSPTKIGSATYCLREAVLNDKFRGPGVPSESLIIGNITHELFQSCLKHNNTDDSYIESFIDQRLKLNSIDIYSTESSLEEIKQIIKQNAEYIKFWISSYINCENIAEFKVTKILDIEENIMSPMFGLRGFIDVVIEIMVPSLGTLVVPMEIKSGKEYLSNRAQVAMYTLLIKDKYDINSKHTNLVYTKGKTNRFNEVKFNDLRHLIQLRNNLSQYMVFSNRKLPPLKQRTSCERCYSLEPCMVLNKLVENGTPEASGIDVDMYLSLTKHIDNPNFTRFFNHWNSLITKEEGFLKYAKADIWKYTSLQREENGGFCIGGLLLQKYEYSSKSLKYLYEFKRENTELISKIAKYDSIILSDDKGKQFGLCDGTVRYIDSSTIIISCGKRWTNSAVRDCDFNKNSNQVFKSVLNTGKESIASVIQETRYRIDKNLFVMGLSMARWNLLNLFLPEVDERKRKLIVELKPPKFHANSFWTTKEDTSKFNSDQVKALDIVSKTEDYSLILGMPGTGKTTVIAHMIKAMIINGKSVLITSYTHSAVDNICEKLIELMGSDVPLLRLGAPSKIKATVQSHSLYSEKFLGDISTREAYHKVIENAGVIAVTCLGISDGIFGKIFDYCIVDEASQVALPVVLGPISFADKFILVGDHHQLPPLVLNPEARADGLEKSLFQILNDAHPQSVVELTYQYRMNEDIMKISNQLVYNGRLKCGNDYIGKRKLEINVKDGSEWIQKVMDPKNSVVFVNYDKLEIKERKFGDQVENPGEAYLISELISNMVSNGVKPVDIGLMSFYNGQLSKFRKILPLDIVDELEMLTADRFQGRDKDVIVISMVRTSELGSLLKEWRRINVAMTRARKKLIIFGHCGLIERELKSMIQIFKENKWIVEPNAKDICLDGVYSQRSSGRQALGKIHAHVNSQSRKQGILSAVLKEMEQ